MNLMEYKAQKPFAQKHLLCLQEYTADEILQLLSLAARLKAERRAGIPHPLLAGKNLAMIFAKPSARTRVSFETGIEQLGGHGLYISAGEIGLGERESVHDVANVFSRFVDGIMIRTFRQSDVEGLAQYGSVPVINGLTDDYHPCQALADMLTLYEVFGDVRGKKLVFVGDGEQRGPQPDDHRFQAGPGGDGGLPRGIRTRAKGNGLGCWPTTRYPAAASG